MSTKIIYNTDEAPAPIGPYNQAIQYGNILYTSGQIALDPKTNNLILGSIEDETHQVMKNLDAILSVADMNFEKVIKTTIFLSDMNHFAAVNKVYESYFHQSYPARETVAVKGLPRGVNVEISMIAGK